MFQWNRSSLEPSDCLSNEIMQTCCHSNKVGLFAEIQLRLFPAEIVVHDLLTETGRCGAFESISPHCSSIAVFLAPVYVLGLRFPVCLVSTISMSHGCYEVVCVG